MCEASVILLGPISLGHMAYVKSQTRNVYFILYASLVVLACVDERSNFRF